MAIFLAGLTDRGRVDDGHHLIQVVHDYPVEQGLVTGLKADQMDVALQVAGLAAIVDQHPFHLLVHGAYAGGQQPAQPQRVTFLLGERGALVQVGITKQLDSSGEFSLSTVLAGRFVLCIHGSDLDSWLTELPRKKLRKVRFCFRDSTMTTVYAERRSGHTDNWQESSRRARIAYQERDQDEANALGVAISTWNLGPPHSNAPVQSPVPKDQALLFYPASRRRQTRSSRRPPCRSLRYRRLAL